MKPKILVVHGALGSAAQMEPVARALEALGDVRNVELRGHGNNEAQADDFTMLAFARQLRDEVTAFTQPGDNAPFVFGYSMGGYAALTLETQHPGIFFGITTLGTKYAWNPAQAAHDAGRLNAAVIAEKIPKFAKMLQDRHARAGGWELVLERTAALLTELGRAPLLTKQSLARVQAQVCVAVGDKDDTVGIDEAREYASYILHATTMVVPDAPHPIERVPVEAIVALVQATFAD